MDHKDNLLGILRTLFKWKKPIIITCLLAGVGSSILVLLLPVYYKASTTFIVASPDQAKPELLFSQGNLEPEFFGNANDIDRVLTIAESNELVDFLVDSFHLYDRYDINPESAKGPYYVKLAFFDRFEIIKTKRDAIQLTVEDQDPDIAAAMAKSAREQIGHITERLLKQSQQKTIEAFKTDIKTKEKYLTIFGDSLAVLRERFGIYNTDAQTESLTGQLDKAASNLTYNKARLKLLESRSDSKRDTIRTIQGKIAGLEDEVLHLKEKLKTFNDGMAPVSVVERQYFEANVSMGHVMEKLKQYETAFESPISTLLLVEEADVPIIKSRPKRTITVLVAVFIAFLFSVIGVLLFDTYKDVNWRSILDEK
ncbi:MAG: Wzz/FepE/Etk N-terminal domain-containing protein [Saprospiraceae bacterium]